jgi:hypothetical protein
MPRFAILCHDGLRGRHWDLLLEAGGVLRTWALPAWPEPDVPMPCEALPDHRLAYLDFEGEISAGRGTVTRSDHGTYEIESEGPAEWIVVLDGEKLTGRVALRLTEPPGQWVFLWEKRGE